MRTIARLFAVTLAFVLLLALGSAVGQQWLQRQKTSVRSETITVRREQFERLVQLARLEPPPWPSETTRALAQAAGAQVIAEVPAHSPPAPDGGAWSFYYPSSNPGEARVRVDFAPSGMIRALEHYQRACVVLALALITLLAALGLVLVLGVHRASEGEGTKDGPTQPHVAEMSSLSRLAKASVEQSAALDRERLERVRIQEDLNFQQVLLNRSLEEKIRLGHDLHDGIIQALYATGLTLEAAKGALPNDASRASNHLDTALGTLNATIRDVRTYILGLSPAELHHRSFEDSVRSISATLSAGTKIVFKLHVDHRAATRLSDSQSVDMLQIVREALSNAIRHGGASEVEVRLEEHAGELCLLVGDNGRGFDLERAARGQGLSNMKARAERLNGNIRCTSSPGVGTRVVLTLYAEQPKAV